MLSVVESLLLTAYDGQIPAKDMFVIFISLPMRVKEIVRGAPRYLFMKALLELLLFLATYLRYFPISVEGALLWFG